MASTAARGRITFLLVAVGLVAVYAATTLTLYGTRSWSDEGPLSAHNQALSEGFPGQPELEQIKHLCRKAGDVMDDHTLKVVGGKVDGRYYYACYDLSNGDVFELDVIDGDGQSAPVAVIKKGGAWPWEGLVKSYLDIFLGGVAMIAFPTFCWLHYRRARPGPPVPTRWWQLPIVNAVLGVTCLLLPLALLLPRRESLARRMRIFFNFSFGWIAFIAGCMLIASIADSWLSFAACSLNVVALAFGYVGGRRLLAPPTWNHPDNQQALQQTGFATSPGYRPTYAPPPPPPPPAPLPRPTVPTPSQDQTAAPLQKVQPKVGRAPISVPGSGRVKPAGSLPTFRDVGGMDSLKSDLQDTLGMLLAFAGEAERYKITFNGILLHGRPGVGKTYVAKAAAGEFGMSFLAVSSGDLISKFVGESAKNIDEVFAEAARNVPCLLFFDEFDSIAERRDDGGLSEESKRVVNQLLTSLEKWRRTGDLVVMAATNHLDRLDPAVIRPGRFDRHVRVDLPDRPARIAIVKTLLQGRPHADRIDYERLSERLAGRTPATIGKVVNAAALTAFQEAAATGEGVEITEEMLIDAIGGLGGHDRPVIEDWSWDKLVLDTTTKSELQQVELLIKDPDLARRYGAEPPSGLLLTGPPGTGKTTIARVFAAQAGYSFYPQTASDLTSKWYGESEAKVSRLFARARENAPAVIFIDEIDSIAGTRDGSGSADDRILTQLLAEIDGMEASRGVFVMAATNRPDTLDPALLRGGRLSRTLEIPLPSKAERLALLTLFTANMPLNGVDLDKLADQTDGLSGADLKALCQQAALEAMIAHQSAVADERTAASGVDTRSFARALIAKRSAHEKPPAASDDGAGGAYL